MPPPAAGARVVILKGDPSEADGNGSSGSGAPAYRLLALPNPSTGQQQQYVLTADGLLEVNRVKHAACCWLVDSSFIADGSIYLASPVNPVLVLLAVLGSQPNQTAGMFQEPESLLCCEQWPAAQALAGLAREQLPCVCDCRELGGEVYFRLNPDKVLAFLRLCVRQALGALRAASPGSVAGLPEDDQLAYALGFTREYVCAAWHERLAASFGHDARALAAQTAGTPAARPPAQPAAAAAATAKKPKAADPQEAARKKAEQSRAAAAAAKLKQVAKGSRKISHFFTAAKPRE